MSVRGSPDPPDPGDVSTAAEFVQRLSDLRLWAGQPSLRKLQWLGGKTVTPHGDEVDALPATTTSYVLRGRGLPRLPRMAFVEAYVLACLEIGGCTTDQARLLLGRWRSGWREVARGDGDRESGSSTALGLVTPAQLPADVVTFTGRADEFDHLHALGTQAHHAITIVITAVDGMAGIGKTALAVHAAHRLAARFPDGQLFSDLHGFTEGVAPVDPADVLDQMLRALGVPGAQIPAELDARAGLYRSQMIGRRMLILLDNAVTESQVEPLLPAAAGSLVLITSRRRLSGLDDVHPVSLDVLPLEDSLALFTRLAGEDHPAERVEEIVEKCGRLPLAIRLAAARLRTRPSWTAAHLAQRLGDHRHRLDALEAGPRSVAAAIDLSYHHLDPDEQRLYRLLGLHPGIETDCYAAAALAATTLRRADRLLSGLYEAHVLREPAPGRYRFHDLIRAHAASTAVREEPVSARRSAITRLLEHYGRCLATATDTVYPYQTHERPGPACNPGTPAPPLTEPAEAAKWLDAELANVLAAARYAAENGWPEHTVYLSGTLHRHLRTRGHYAQADTLHAQALAAARKAGDRAGEVTALIRLGFVQRFLGRHEAAIDRFEHALTITQEIGYPVGEVEALNGLGDIHRLQGRHDHAAQLFSRVLKIAHGIGDRNGEVDAETGLGDINAMEGHYQQAARHYQQALATAGEIGHRANQVVALTGLGHVHRFQGRHDPAIEAFERALSLARDIGYPAGEVDALTGLGNLCYSRGRYDEAVNHFEKVLIGARTIGSRNYQFEALHGLGLVRQALGRPEAGLTCHQAALDIARELGQLEDQARVHDGIARAQQSLGDLDNARRHWRAALNILDDLHLDQADELNAEQIRAKLADVNSSGG